MKILFVSTFNTPMFFDHVFTINVFQELRRQCAQQGHQLKACTFAVNGLPSSYKARMCQEFGDCDIVAIDPDKDFTQQFTQYFAKEQPQVIHSNMIEGWDIEAARHLNITIFNTIHIGAFLCPRGGGQGFLRYDDSICNRPVSRHCDRCMAELLPFPRISYALHKMVPRAAEYFVARRLNRQVLYLTAFLRQTIEPDNKLRFIETAKYTNIIAGNQELVNLLRINGIKDRVHLLPHGIVERQHLELPPLEAGKPIKFYFLGSTLYTKGVHVLLEAFKGIPHESYELHIIGDVSHLGPKSKGQKYFEKIQQQARGLNVIFDGRIGNHELESKIADYHVMIHSGIVHEIYGLTIAESLSMGRPVIATRCGGSEMQVVDGHNGWLVKPNDASDLRRAIEDAIRNPSEIQRRAANAKTPHLVAPYVEKLISLYSNAYNEQLS